MSTPDIGVDVSGMGKSPSRKGPLAIIARLFRLDLDQVSELGSDNFVVYESAASLVHKMLQACMYVVSGGMFLLANVCPLSCGMFDVGDKERVPQLYQ